MDQVLRVQAISLRNHITREFKCVIAFFLIITVLIAGVFYRLNHQRTIILPAVIGQGLWVSEVALSKSYLEDMTKYFIFLRFNVSSQNVIDQQRCILRYTTPIAEKMLASILKSESEPIIKNNISTLFYPYKMHINNDDLSVDVEGEHVFIFAPNHIVRHRKAFHLAYEQTPVGIRLSQFHEVKYHD